MDELQWIVDHNQNSLVFYTQLSEEELVEELLKPLTICIMPSYQGYAIFNAENTVYLLPVTSLSKWKRAYSNGVGAPRRPAAYTNTFDAQSVLRIVLGTSRTLA